MPIFPILILSICWYSKQVSLIIIKYLSNYIRIKRFLLIHSIILILLLVVFSNHSWKQLISDFLIDINQHEVRILESHGPEDMYGYDYSMKASFEQLHSLTRDCKGILTIEYLFFGAFILPHDRVHSMWISDYTKKSIQQNSIDCVLLSNYLMSLIPHHQDVTYNYENFIKPYVLKIKELGAETYQIPQYGEAVILKRQLIH